jgi:hypothetical protein
MGFNVVRLINDVAMSGLSDKVIASTGHVHLKGQSLPWKVHLALRIGGRDSDFTRSDGLYA